MFKKFIQFFLPFELVVYAVAALILLAAFFSGNVTLAILTLALVVGGLGGLAVAVGRSGLSISQMRESERQRRLASEKRAARIAHGELIRNALAASLAEVLELVETPPLHADFADFGFIFGFRLGTRALADLDPMRLLTGVQGFLPEAGVCDLRVRERPEQGCAVIEIHTADRLAGVRGVR